MATVLDFSACFLTITEIKSGRAAIYRMILYINLYKGKHQVLTKKEGQELF